MHRRPAEDASGQPAPPRPLVVFIGGAGDRTLRKVGRVFRRAAARPDAALRDLRYVSHFQQHALLALVAAQPPGRPIRLIGHSWGGHAAARVAAALGARGGRLDLLVTVDPVARGIDSAFLARVKAGARLWINARAAGGERFHPSDLVAAIGGPYGEAPRGFADLHLDLPQPHAAFGAMMECRLPDGRSLLDLALA